MSGMLTNLQLPRYYGHKAVEQAKRYYQQAEISPVAAHIIEEEGFVPGVYPDHKNIPTEGIGLTGEFIGKNFFTEVMPVFERRARNKIKNYDSLPSKGKQAVMSAIYRGDMGPKTAKLLSQGKYKEAAKEYLDHSEYKDLKKNNPRNGVVGRMERNAKVFASLGDVNT